MDKLRSNLLSYTNLQQIYDNKCDSRIASMRFGVSVFPIPYEAYSRSAMLLICEPGVYFRHPR